MTTDVFTWYATLDPAAEPGIEPEWYAIDVVVSSTIDGRTTTVSNEVKQPTSPPMAIPAATNGPTTGSRTGARVAIPAFVLVLVAGVAALLIFQFGHAGSDDVASVPTAPFETTHDAVEAWVDAINYGTAEEIHAMMGDSYTGFSDFVGPTVAETDERIRFLRALWVAPIALGLCEESSPQWISCEATMASPVMELLDGVDHETEQFTVRLDDAGYILSFRSVPGSHDAFPHDLREEFVQWIETDALVPQLELNPWVDSTGQLDISPEDAAERLMAEINRFLAQREG